MSKILITGTSHVQGAAAAEVFSMWATLVRKLNPGVDVLVIDAASPTPLPVERWTHDFACVSLSNVGHLARGGRDGWGRAFSAGVSHAMDRGYDWLANVECDILFAHSVESVIARMIRSGVKCCAPMALPYCFTETGLSFWSVPYLREIDLIARYDWENPPDNGLFPEQRIDAICADDMWVLPIRGFRNDVRASAPGLRQMFPHGVDWITHCEVPVFREFLKMNKHE